MGRKWRNLGDLNANELSGGEKFSTPRAKRLAASVVGISQRENERQQAANAKGKKEAADKQAKDTADRHKAQADASEANRKRNIRAGSAAGMETKTDVDSGKTVIDTHADGAPKFKPKEIGKPVEIGKQTTAFKGEDGNTHQPARSNIMLGGGGGDGAAGAGGTTSKAILGQEIRDDRGKHSMVTPSSTTNPDGIKYVTGTDPTTGQPTKQAVGIDQAKYDDAKRKEDYDFKKNEIALRENSVKQTRAVFDPKYEPVKKAFDESEKELKTFTEGKYDYKQVGTTWTKTDKKTGVTTAISPKEAEIHQRDWDETKKKSRDATEAHNRMFSTESNLQLNEAKIAKEKLDLEAEKIRGDSGLPADDGGVAKILARAESGERVLQEELDDANLSAIGLDPKAWNFEPATDEDGKPIGPETFAVPTDPNAKPEKPRQLGVPEVTDIPIGEYIDDADRFAEQFKGIVNPFSLSVDKTAGGITIIKRDGKQVAFMKQDKETGNPYIILNGSQLNDQIKQTIAFGGTEGMDVYLHSHGSPNPTREAQWIAGVFQTFRDDPAMQEEAAAQAKLLELGADPASIYRKVRSGDLSVQRGEALMKDLYGGTLKATDPTSPEALDRYMHEQASPEFRSRYAIAKGTRDTAGLNAVKNEYLSQWFVENRMKPGVTFASRLLAEKVMSGEFRNIEKAGSIGSEAAQVAGSMIGMLGAIPMMSGLGFYGVVDDDAQAAFNKNVENYGRGSRNTWRGWEMTRQKWTTKEGKAGFKVLNDARGLLLAQIGAQDAHPESVDSKIWKDGYVKSLQAVKDAAYAMHKIAGLEEGWEITPEDIDKLDWMPNAYALTGDRSILDSYFTALMEDHGSRQAQEYLAELTAGRNPFMAGIIGGAHAPPEEVGLEILSTILTGGTSKIVMGGTKAAAAIRATKKGTQVAGRLNKLRAKAHGVAADFKALGLMKDTVAKPLGKLGKASNKGVQLGKVALVSGVQETFEEGAMALADRNATAGSLAHDAGIGFLAGFFLAPAMGGLAGPVHNHKEQAKRKESAAAFAAAYNESGKGDPDFVPLTPERAEMAMVLSSPKEHLKVWESYEAAEANHEASARAAGQEGATNEVLNQHSRNQAALQQAIDGVVKFAAARAEAVQAVEALPAEHRGKAGAILKLVTGRGDLLTGAERKAAGSLTTAEGMPFFADVNGETVVTDEGRAETMMHFPEIGALIQTTESQALVDQQLSPAGSETSGAESDESDAPGVANPTEDESGSGIPSPEQQAAPTGNSAPQATELDAIEYEFARQDNPELADIPEAVQQAFESGQPVSDSLATASGIEIPSDYVKDGNRWVSNPLEGQASPPATTGKTTSEQSSLPSIEPRPSLKSQYDGHGKEAQKAWDEKNGEHYTPYGRPKVNAGPLKAPKPPTPPDYPTFPNDGTATEMRAAIKAQERWTEAWGDTYHTDGTLKYVPGSIPQRTPQPPKAPKAPTTLKEWEAAKAKLVDDFKAGREVSAKDAERHGLSIPKDYTKQGGKLRKKEDAMDRPTVTEAELETGQKLATEIIEELEAAFPNLKGRLSQRDNYGEFFTGGVGAKTNGTLELYPLDIAAASKIAKSTAALKKEITSTIIGHEVIHMAQVEAVRSEWESAKKQGHTGKFSAFWTKRYGEIFTELSQSQTLMDTFKQIYDTQPLNSKIGSTWDHIPESSQAVEGIRILMEVFGDGSRTEEQRVFSELFRAELQEHTGTAAFLRSMLDALKAIYSKLADGSPFSASINSHIKSVDAIYAELTASEASLDDGSIKVGDTGRYTFEDGDTLPVKVTSVDSEGNPTVSYPSYSHKRGGSIGITAEKFVPDQAQEAAPAAHFEISNEDGQTVIKKDEITYWRGEPAEAQAELKRLTEAEFSSMRLSGLAIRKVIGRISLTDEQIRDLESVTEELAESIESLPPEEREKAVERAVTEWAEGKEEEMEQAKPKTKKQRATETGAQRRAEQIINSGQFEAINAIIESGMRITPRPNRVALILKRKENAQKLTESEITMLKRIEGEYDERITQSMFSRAGNGMVAREILKKLIAKQGEGLMPNVMADQYYRSTAKSSDLWEQLFKELNAISNGTALEGDKADPNRQRTDEEIEKEEAERKDSPAPITPQEAFEAANVEENGTEGLGIYVGDMDPEWQGTVLRIDGVDMLVADVQMDSLGAGVETVTLREVNGTRFGEQLLSAEDTIHAQATDARADEETIFASPSPQGFFDFGMSGSMGSKQQGGLDFGSDPAPKPKPAKPTRDVSQKEDSSLTNKSDDLTNKDPDPAPTGYDIGDIVEVTLIDGTSQVGKVSIIGGILHINTTTDILLLDKDSVDNILDEIDKIEVVRTATEEIERKQGRKYGEMLYEQPTTRDQYESTLWQLLKDAGAIRTEADKKSGHDAKLNRRAMQIDSQFDLLADQINLAKSKRRYMGMVWINAVKGKRLPKPYEFSDGPQMELEFTPPKPSDFDPNSITRKKRHPRPLTDYDTKDLVEKKLTGAISTARTTKSKPRRERFELIVKKHEKTLAKGEYEEAQMEKRGLTSPDVFAHYEPSDITPAAKKTTVDEGAQEAATSEENATPEPSQAQKEAGNYKVGKIRLGGMDISIENPAGSERKGIDPNGKPWSITMKSHYGYVKGSIGKDGDHIDIFIKQGTPLDFQGSVFVVNQNNKDGSFDEHKAVLGTKIQTKEQAKAEYLRNYAKGWTGAGEIAHFETVEAFREWVLEKRRIAPAKDTGKVSNDTEAMRKKHGDVGTYVLEGAVAHAQGIPLKDNPYAKIKDPLHSKENGEKGEDWDKGQRLEIFYDPEVKPAEKPKPTSTPTTAKEQLFDWAGDSFSSKPGAAQPNLFDSKPQTEETKSNDISSSTNLEPDSQDAGTTNTSGEDLFSVQPGTTQPARRPVGQGGKISQDTGSREPLSADVPSTPTRSTSDASPSPAKPKSQRSNPGDTGRKGRSKSDDGGVSPQRPGAEEPQTDLILSPSGSQSLAPSSGTDTSGSSKREDGWVSPLTPEQQGDVDFVKRRLYDNKKAGVLLTNGTGTGKTFSGLGVIKDALDDGAKHILIVAPSDGVGGAWKSTAQDFFGILDADQLLDTKDNGSGNRVVITTYANLGQNNSLSERPWDMIVTDEAHYLSQSKQGKETNALDRFRALTWHNGGMRDRADMLHPKEAARIAEMMALPLEVRSNDGWSRELDGLTAIIQATVAKLNAEREAMEKKPKSLMLSATPFAYHFSLDYAEGYLFEHGKEPKDKGYNTPSARDRFYVENFGYRMTYGQLTTPDAAAAAATGIMERRFAQGLMKSGAMSGRALKVDKDYSRDFVITESAIGTKIDEILETLRENERFSVLGEYLGLGNYLARRYLLEGIKAREAVGRIRKHIALGRKVVVFHDYKKGGATNPLNPSFAPGEEKSVTYKDGTEEMVNLLDRFNELKRAIPGYEATRRQLNNLASPIQVFEREFPGVVGIYNGSESKGTRKAVIKKFNQSGSGMDILLGQRAASKEGISLHDLDGQHQRAFMDIGMPSRPTDAIQGEGRIYRFGVVSNAIVEYVTTGTSVERWTFAQTIAQRSSTAENLAMGEEARALLQAYANGYNDASSFEPHSGQGTGGKEMDRARNDDNPFKTAIALYFTNQKKTSSNKSAEGSDYFATPEPVGFKMVEWADIQPGEKVLEPSGGHGAIARFFPDSTNRHAVEPSNELAGRLALNATDTTIHNMSFEDYYIGNKFHGIAMNPPFGTAGKLAMDHLIKALGHLHNGGRVVALIPQGSSMEKRFDKWYESKEADHYFMRGEIIMPSVTFARAGTGVSTRIVIIDRLQTPKGVDTPSMPSSNYDLSSVTTAQELFDRIENITMPQRPEANFEIDETPDLEPAAPKQLTAMDRVRQRIHGKPAAKPQARFKPNAVGIPDLPLSSAKTVAQSEYTSLVYDLERKLLGNGTERTGWSTIKNPSGLMAVSDEAKKRGWKMIDVTERARIQLGLDETFSKEGSQEQEYLKFLQSEMDRLYPETKPVEPKKEWKPWEPVKAIPKPETEGTWSPAEFNHTKTGAPIFVVKINRRLDREEFLEAKAQAKALGGGYSRYNSGGAIPGFHFKSAEARDAFIGSDNGTSDTGETLRSSPATPDSSAFLESTGTPENAIDEAAARIDTALEENSQNLSKDYQQDLDLSPRKMPEAAPAPVADTGATSVTLDSLPDDMQVLIGDLAQDEGQESYQVVEIPISDLPNLPIADGTQDQRGEPTVQAMVDSTDELPPIIVSGDNILDGRHRIEAARRKGVTSIKAIDIGALVSCMCKKLKSSKP